MGRKRIDDIDLEVKVDLLADSLDASQDQIGTLMNLYQLPSSIVPSLVASRRAIKAAVEHVKATQMLIAHKS